MTFRSIRTAGVAAALLGAGMILPTARGQDDPAIAAVRDSTAQLAKAFNAGKVDELTAMFLPKGELIDEDGNVFQGQQEIKELLAKFFSKYPRAKVTLDVESIRLVGPVAIEEGTRTATTSDGTGKARVRYIAIRVKTNSGWQIASLRDFTDDDASTPHERLEPLAWLVGDWVNEGADASVRISYRWSEDKNFLLGEFQISPDGKPATKSSQRIGWDPLAGRIRSWLFDADGGFAEGFWTIVDDEVVIKSSSVNPDGESASATLTLTQVDASHYSIKGTERIVGDEREPDFDITVARRPPAAGK
jgi:uncharacterized protein (TIGR02246 family)